MEHRETDEEAVGWSPGAQPERGRQRVALRRRQAIKAVEQATAELMQTREGKLHLRLNPDHACQPIAICPVGGVV
jgi:hypothetical protein